MVYSFEVDVSEIDEWSWSNGSSNLFETMISSISKFHHWMSFERERNIKSIDYVTHQLHFKSSFKQIKTMIHKIIERISLKTFWIRPTRSWTYPNHENHQKPTQIYWLRYTPTSFPIKFQTNPDDNSHSNWTNLKTFWIRPTRSWTYPTWISPIVVKWQLNDFLRKIGK